MLSRGLDQAVAELGAVDEQDLSRTTPCHEWTVAELVDHLVAAPANFARMMRGQEIDWSAPPPHVGEERADAFRANADDLLDAWHAVGDEAGSMGPDWQTSEIAVHTYDLVTALGRPTADLDPEVAERGLALMQANLTADNRAPAFDPELPAPDGADAYERIAAFAGRTVTASR